MVYDQAVKGRTRRRRSLGGGSKCSAPSFSPMSRADIKATSLTILFCIPSYSCFLLLNHTVTRYNKEGTHHWLGEDVRYMYLKRGVAFASSMRSAARATFQRRAFLQHFILGPFLHVTIHAAYTRKNHLSLHKVWRSVNMPSPIRFNEPPICF